MQAQQHSYTGTLAERAMLVDLTIRKFTSQRQDRAISAEVARNHGSDATMGRYTKSLIAREHLEQINQISAEAYAEHRRRTLPWLNNGTRVLSSAGFLDYTVAMRDFEDRFNVAVDAFVKDYPDYVRDAQIRLNGLFDPSQYPSAGQIMDSFGFGYNVLPMPTGDDFRVNLGDAEVSHIRQQIEDAGKQAIEAARKDVGERIRDVAGRMVRRLTEYGTALQDRAASGATGKSGAPKLHDSLVDNVRELVALLPTLNLTDDPALDKIRAEMESALCVYSADALKQSQDKRKITVQAAEAILEQVDAFLA